MPAPRSYDPELLRRARAGLLTRSRAQTAEELSVVRHVQYEERLHRYVGGTARERAGHLVLVEPRIASFFTREGGPHLVVVPGVSANDLRRAGAYMAAVGKLLADLKAAAPGDEARIKQTFERRFRRWRPIAGLHVLAAADAVAAVAVEVQVGGPEIVFDSGRTRSGRRRRR
ncbi:MAG: hypothetical protein ACRD0B_00425 [Acidimicrobiales bacterium]